MNRDTYRKPSRFVPVFLVAALTGCLIPAARGTVTNPDPGGAQVTSFRLSQVPYAGSSYDPLVKLPGTDTYQVIPDRTGRITLAGQITHDFNGTITSTIKDADGVTAASGTGTSLTLAFEPLKYRFPLVWTITSAEGDLMFGTLLILGHGGGRNDPGFIGGGRVTTDTVPVSDEEITIQQYGDEGSYDEAGKSGNGGSCGGCNSCDLTNSDETETVDAGGTAGTFMGGFSAGTSKQGDSKSGVDVMIDPTAGVSISSFKSFGSGDAVITRSDGHLQSIATATSYVSFDTTDGVQVDISKTSGGTAYRTIKFENTDTNEVTRTSTYGGKEIVTVWTYDDSTNKVWTVVSGNGARKYEVTRTDDGTDPTIRVELHKRYERVAGTTGTAAVLVSEVQKTFKKTILGWRKTKSEVLGLIDNPLVTQWAFYGAAAGALKAGLLASVTYPDGRTENHDYYVDTVSAVCHSIKRPFADVPGTAETTTPETETRVKPSTGNDRIISIAKGSTYRKTTRTWGSSPPTLSEKTDDGAGDLTRNYQLTAFGTDFGGKPTRVVNPDGTVNTQVPERSGSMKNLTVKRGFEDGGLITEGVNIATIRNSNGVLVSKLVTAIGTGDGAELERVTAASPDPVGRPTVISYFGNGTAPAYTVEREYACCGLAWEQDRYGIKTYFAYDDLGRRIKTNRLGVTHETVYDGLTVRRHRYVGTGETWTGAADPSNEISNITRDVSGTVSHSWERSPETEVTNPNADPPTLPTDAALFTISTTQYRNGAADDPNPHSLPDGVGMRETVNYVEVSGDDGDPEQQTDYYLDGRLKETSGDMENHVRYSYEVNATGLKTTREYVDGGIGKESVTTQYDKAGRTKTVTQDGNVTIYIYGAVGSGNGAGKLVRVEDGDGVNTFYGYDSEGQRELTVLDLNGDGEMDPASDRYTLTISNPGIYNDGTVNHHVITTETTVFPAGATYPDDGILVSRSHSAVDGLGSWNIRFPGGANLTTSSLTHLSTTAGSWTETTKRPDGTYSVASYVGGLPHTTCQYASGGGNPITTVTYGYGTDGLNRLATVTDSRTGDTRTAYFSATCDAVKSVTEENGNLDRETAFTYDHRGRRLTVDAPDTDYDNITTTDYFPDGSVKSISGDQTYETEYTYDYAGRMKTLKTFGGTPATTTWLYDTTYGRLVEKNYHGETDNGTTDADYTYTIAGRLNSRVWERGVTTDYHYNQGGQLLAVDYSDSTPDVLYTRDRLGRVETAAQGPMSFPGGVPTINSAIRSVTHTYDDTDFYLASEAIDYGGSFTKTLNRYLDAYLRPLSIKVGTEYTAAYGHDTSGRINRAWDHPALNTAGVPVDEQNAPLDDGDFTYGYKSDSYGLVETVTGQAHSVTNTWEPTRDVLATKINEETVGTHSIPSSFAYGVNAIGQRETGGPVLSNNTPVSTYTPKWAWKYNSRGEMVYEDAGANTGDDGEIDPHDRVYQFDAIGNREKTLNGYLSSLPAADANYEANALNQYIKANNVDLPAAPAPAPYDQDGNLRFDGGVNITAGTTNPAEHQYVWDAENRLIEVAKIDRYTSGEIALTTSLVTYAYDHLSRLVIRTATAAAPGGAVTTRYLYDGWNRIAEYSGQTLKKTYLWGMDLSGTMQGAGGVGGLLAVSEHSGTAQNPVRSPYYPAFDGNGNVTEYLSGGGVVVAHYEYDAFGNDITPTANRGEMHDAFAHRFSTKPFDPVLGWYYYGYRWYDPLTGRWPSRDPIGENGGVNLYGFVRNSPIATVDTLGARFGVSTWQKGDCLEISLKLKIFIPEEIDMEKLEDDLRQRGYNPEQIKILAEDYKSRAKALKEFLIADNAGKSLGKQLNDVFGNKNCCCLTFSVTTSQAPHGASLGNGQIGLRVRFDIGREGRVKEIGGNEISSINSGDLLSGKNFTHEMGHIFGLHHPHPDNLHSEHRKQLIEEGFSDESIKTALSNPGNNYLNQLILGKGYDYTNKLRGIDAMKNIMGYGDGKDVTCDQINEIKNWAIQTEAAE